MNDNYEACLVIDDFPANGSYWRRAQTHAFGYPTPEVCEWSIGWPRQAAAPFINVDILRGLVDLVEEFDIRGKMTILPCPGGLGRIDRSIRNLDDRTLKEILKITRDRLAGRFDLSLEVLTHSMALDIKTGALLPHTESAWVSHLASPGKGHHEMLCEYIDHGVGILSNAGFSPKCVSIGGMPDVSGITRNRMLHDNHNIKRLADAVHDVFSRHFPNEKAFFVAASSRYVGRISKTRALPEKIRTYGDGTSIFHSVTSVGESPLSLFSGRGNPETTADSLVSKDLKGGSFIKTLESGRALVFLCHAQTLSSINTGLGLTALQIALKRLRQRYGRQLNWKTPTELVNANKSIYKMK